MSAVNNFRVEDGSVVNSTVVSTRYEWSVAGPAGIDENVPKEEKL